MMVAEDSSVPWARRWQVWALALALAAVATVGGLALAGRDQPAPAKPTAHIGSLAKLPDEEFMNLLPARADFSKNLKGFLALTAEQLREHPEPALPVDPPHCDPTAPLRGPSILGEVRTDSVAAAVNAATAYTVGVARERPDENLVTALDTWLQGCPEAALPSASNDRETRLRKVIMERLPAPSIGADRAISYVITVVDAPGGGADDVLYPPQTHVMTLAMVRGVALYCLARNTSPEADADDNERLLSKWVQRIRTY
ncbi:MAG: hypothetical protein ACRC20_10405 [Segniliparus sp.]|uniref:hypothetical protein n=1 Tax=Segniliparus sp. TaxID=2804064 RepID=UPI003F4164DD